MAPSTFDAAAARNQGLVRKALKGAVLLGKHSVAPIITTLNATGGQIEVPEQYESVGWISEDGLTFTREREISDVRGWGSGSFLRRDIQSEDHGIQFAALETKRLTHELRAGRDLANEQMSAEGEWKYDILEKPGLFYWRVLALGVDGDGADRFYTAKVYHKAVVTEMDDEAWTDGDDPLMYNVTLSAVPDDETGTLGTEFIFGPGALAAAEAMGLTVTEVTP